jgi:hypothetical protein
MTRLFLSRNIEDISRLSRLHPAEYRVHLGVPPQAPMHEAQAMGRISFTLRVQGDAPVALASPVAAVL